MPRQQNNPNLFFLSPQSKRSSHRRHSLQTLATRTSNIPGIASSFTVTFSLRLSNIQDPTTFLLPSPNLPSTQHHARACNSNFSCSSLDCLSSPARPINRKVARIWNGRQDGDNLGDARFGGAGEVSGKFDPVGVSALDGAFEDQGLKVVAQQTFVGTQIDSCIVSGYSLACSHNGHRI